MKIDVDFLTATGPNAEPVTTHRVERTQSEGSGSSVSWNYLAEFDEMPPCVNQDDADVAVHGVVEGTVFHITEPRMLVDSPLDGDGPVRITFWATSNSYERFGTVERRAGAWTELATTGIADPNDVRRATAAPEATVDGSQVARSRAAHHWRPTSDGGEAFPGRFDLIDLVCTFPEDTPARLLAELAATYMDVDEAFVRHEIAFIREQLRAGESPGRQLMRPDSSVWTYTPPWATPFDGDCDGL